jgi:hypothetical protein
VPQGTVGSNPTLSVEILSDAQNSLPG